VSKVDTDLTDLSRTGISRRTLLKTTAATGLAVAAAHPKASRVFAAPTVLQGTPLSLKYATWFWWEPGRQDAWRYIVNKFNTSQSDIKIEEAGWPFNDFTNNIVVQLNAGGLEADLVQTTPDLVLRLLQAETLEPLQDVIDSLGIKDLSSAHQYITVDGKVMGLDVVTVVFGLFYNLGIFEKEGVTTMPTTVEDWLALSTQLTHRPDQFGMHSSHVMAEPESFWFQLQEWAMPYDGVWAKGKDPQVTTDPIINGVKLFKQFYDATFPQGSNDATATRQWQDQQIAQQLIVSAAVNVFSTNAPELYPNIRSMSMPWASKKSIARIHPITVNVGGDHIDESKEFVKFLYTPENYRELMEKCLDVIPSYGVGELDDYLGQLKWLDGYKDMTYTTPPDVMGDFIFNNQEFGQIVINHVTEVLTANRPVEDAMGDAQKELEDLAGRLEG
jgi:ABC-type glycerol-3-phosphate transport system substrate-binding protein